MIISMSGDNENIEADAPRIPSSTILRTLTTADAWRRYAFIGSSTNILAASVSVDTTSALEGVGLFFMIEYIGGGNFGPLEKYRVQSGRYRSFAFDGLDAIESCEFYVTKTFTCETLTDIVEFARSKSLCIIGFLNAIVDDFDFYARTYESSPSDVPIYSVATVASSRILNVSTVKAFSPDADGGRVIDDNGCLVNDGYVEFSECPLDYIPKRRDVKKTISY